MNPRVTTEMGETRSGRRRRPWLPAALASFTAASFLGIFLQIVLYSPISPHPHLQLPSATALAAAFSNPLINDGELQQLISKIGEGFVKDAEDICVDTAAGILYAANRDGWIKRFHFSNGSLENWKNTHSYTLLGVTTSKDGGILVCDAEKVGCFIYLLFNI